MSPGWGDCTAAIPPETQFLLVDLGGGKHGIMLPLIDSGAFRGTLAGGGADGALGLRMESGNPAIVAESWKGEGSSWEKFPLPFFTCFVF
jgi:hypothetical protein